MVVKNSYHKIYRLKFYYFYLKTKSKWARKETLFCWGPLLDFSYSTFLHFSCPLKSFSQHLLLHFPKSKKKKKKRKRVWYFLLYAFNFRCSHPLSLVLLCSSSKKKKKNYSKEWDFSDFLLNLRCSFPTFI